MAQRGIDVYLGSRLRTLSWTLDAFCPWRSFVVIPAEGLPTAFTFVIDASRVGDDSWLGPERVLGYAPMGGQDQISAVSDLILSCLKGKKGVVGIESGMAPYLPEGNLTHYEYECFQAALDGCQLVNAHDLIDELSLIKEPGEIMRSREASRQVDIGHQAVREAIQNGGYRGLTETEIGGLAAYAMRKAGSEWEWSFTGGNEIASGYRTGLAGGACTPASRRLLQPGEPFMVDLHAMFRLCLGDHSHNYLLGARHPAPALARPELRRPGAAHAGDLQARHDPQQPGGRAVGLLRRTQFRRIYGARLRARHRHAGRRVAHRPERRSFPLLDQSRSTSTSRTRC